MTTFRHVMMLRFDRDVTGDQREALAAGLAKMPEIMDYIQRYEFGSDLGLGDENFDFALVADFESAKDFEMYSKNPDHQILVHNLVRPIAAEVVRVQYEVD